jgi:hypothetical protein
MLSLIDTPNNITLEYKLAESAANRAI